MGFDWVFSRLYILLCILSSNAFGHFGLGKCKLVILRCRFHCKNAGFEELTTGILHFLVLPIINLHFPSPKCPMAFLERMPKRIYNLEFRGKPFFDFLWDLNVAECLQTYADI